MFIMQQSQESANRNGAQQPAAVVDDGDIRIMAFDGAQRHRLGRITGENVASIELHARCGFVEAGVEREVGRKFGRWLDVVTMQLMLD